MMSLQGYLLIVIDVAGLALVCGWSRCCVCSLLSLSPFPALMVTQSLTLQTQSPIILNLGSYSLTPTPYTIKSKPETVPFANVPCSNDPSRMSSFSAAVNFPTCVGSFETQSCNLLRISVISRRCSTPKRVWI